MADDSLRKKKKRRKKSSSGGNISPQKQTKKYSANVKSGFKKDKPKAKSTRKQPTKEELELRKIRRRYARRMREIDLSIKTVPFFKTEEEYENYWQDILGGKYPQYPEELEKATEKLEEFFRENTGKNAPEGGNRMGDIKYLKDAYYGLSKTRRRELLSRAPETAIKAIETILLFPSDDSSLTDEERENRSASFFAIYRILSGGEILNLDESYRLFNAPDFEEQEWEIET